MVKKTGTPDQHVTEGEVSLSSPERLDAILFQFVNLYERWAEDRQVTAKQGADIAKFVKEFSQAVHQFSSFERHVKEEIRARLHAETERVSQRIGGVISDSAKREIGPMVDTLKAVTSEVSQVMKDYRWHRRFSYWVGMGSMMFAAMGSSIVIAWLLMPMAISPISEGEVASCYVGQELVALWPSLSKETQSLLMAKVENESKCRLEK